MYGYKFDIDVLLRIVSVKSQGRNLAYVVLFRGKSHDKRLYLCTLQSFCPRTERSTAMSVATAVPPPRSSAPVDCWLGLRNTRARSQDANSVLELCTLCTPL